MNFIEYLQALIPVSEGLRAELGKISKRRTLDKGQYLIRSGEQCSDLYYLEQGMLRGFYFSEDKEITNWFSREGEFATCFYAFITRTPSYESVEALEDTTLIQLPYNHLQQLYTSFPETERIGRILTEAYYVRLESRLLSLRFTSAKERYDALVRDYPALLQRASLGQIASYLGISQETLSRVRAK